MRRRRHQQQQQRRPNFRVSYDGVTLSLTALPVQVYGKKVSCTNVSWRLLFGRTNYSASNKLQLTFIIDVGMHKSGARRFPPRWIAFYRRRRRQAVSRRTGRRAVVGGRSTPRERATTVAEISSTLSRSAAAARPPAAVAFSRFVASLY